MSFQSVNFSFGKYHGLFNSFILIDWRDISAALAFDTNTANIDSQALLSVKTDVEKSFAAAREKGFRAGFDPSIICPIKPEEAIRLCSVSSGIGADGIMVCLPSIDETSNYVMRMLNSDGSIAEMCGNGIRCLASYLYDIDVAAGKISGKHTYKFCTLAGLIQCDVSISTTEKSTAADDTHTVRVNMGAPILDASLVPCVVPDVSLTELPLMELGLRRNAKSALYVPIPDILADLDGDQLAAQTFPQLRTLPTIPDNAPVRVSLSSSSSSSSTNQISASATHSRRGSSQIEPEITAGTATTLFSEWRLFTKTFTAVSMGNPHVIVRLPECDTFCSKTESLANTKWTRFRDIAFPVLGPWLSSHANLFPRGANVEFVRVVETDGTFALETLVWERGCGATMACGTGACAVVVAAKLCAEVDIASKEAVQVILPGGSLWIEFFLDGQVSCSASEDLENPIGLPEVTMTGPAAKIFSGVSKFLVL